MATHPTPGSHGSPAWVADRLRGLAEEITRRPGDALHVSDCHDRDGRPIIRLDLLTGTLTRTGYRLDLPAGYYRGTSSPEEYDAQLAERDPREDLRDDGQPRTPAEAEETTRRRGLWPDSPPIRRRHGARKDPA